jgi:thiamine pyrophosphate-dependent acetolactate synthase large subunit-like protein
MAIGAAIARPGERVTVILGDRFLMMSLPSWTRSLATSCP